MSESLSSQVEETKVSDEDGVKEKAEVSTAKDSAETAMEVEADEAGGQQPEQSELLDKEKSATVDINTLTPSTPSQTPPQLLAGETATSGSTAVIPENILSPPKSETQTDETNTATSTSCSPASDGQRSPAAEQQSSAPPPQVQAQATAAPVNGSVPKSGKPLSTALSGKKTSKAATTSPRASRCRKTKALPMYESEISDNKMGIKLCIKKSDAGEGAPAGVTSPPVTVPAATKTVRKRVRKPKQQDSDEAEYEPRKKKGGGGGSGGEKKVSTSPDAAEAAGEPIEQSVWAQKLPEEVLFRIFEHAVDTQGCLPTLFRLGRVCSLWRQVSLRPTLWRTMDLTTWVKEKYRTELKLKWFVDNRCSACTDLNVSNWKISDINCFLAKLSSGCPNLQGITLSGWKGFTSDHLTYLVDNMHKLQRLDLSSINVEMNASKSAVGVNSLCNALQTMGSRLTHLYLAHNRLAGIPQIVGILSTHCPNLTLLDLSNVTTQATSHGVLHIEKLQRGCQKLKVLRVTNSHITPSTASMQEIMDSPGFPELEELSVAALTDESRIISDDHLQRILKSSSKLKLLDVRNCTRLTHESLIRLPAWDIKHLFLSGCSVTRDMGSGLELIASKWAHSLIELDLAWANMQQPIDNALRALAEKGRDSPLAHLNLCGSSVSDEAVKEILTNCQNMSSINLASCRGLPRGVKRLMQGPQELGELREVLGVQLKSSSGSN
ncbi:F-box/LRR-repeat protein 6 [Drosophila mauritiana]|uniref:F-box/LRR-repeat protein 6 n=1 Tax=Drosophila mauritiana TaxID=7226 RepID=A0A6P8JIX1_DROMA|nr:F-box/LRR-repeat protein 6 [Drosophila mauritiana]XP_033156252.1 F-box/LRR-repeat protein 6 [Drosophila mauritiana]XP_033156253.1 F-box/LRR-repeat protein 6 [Drosophila mauritiana]